MPPSSFDVVVATVYDRALAVICPQVGGSPMAEPKTVLQWAAWLGIYSSVHAHEPLGPTNFGHELVRQAFPAPYDTTVSDPIEVMEAVLRRTNGQSLTEPFGPIAGRFRAVPRQEAPGATPGGRG